MAMTITDDCINCGSCEIECPRGGIRPAPGHYQVDASMCTECRDEGGSRCVMACPVGCIVPQG